MTDINFYVSKQDGLLSRLNIAYRLIGLAQQRGLSIHIHTDNEQTSQKIDELLWKKESQSFIPHIIVNNEDTGDTYQNEITISCDFEPMQHCDYLINLSNQRPAFFSRFKKVAEILDSTEDIISAGRKRYAFYKERGYTLGYHKL